MAMDAITQRVIGTFLAGMGMAFVICSTVTWSRKFNRNRNKLLQLVVLLLAFLFNALMLVVAMDFIKLQISARTTVAAFCNTRISTTAQYIYMYFMTIRLFSVLEGRQRFARALGYLVAGLIVCSCLLNDGANFYSLSQSKMNIVLFTNNKYFNQIAKGSSTTGTLLYTVMLTVTDILLLTKIKGIKATLSGGKSRGMASHQRVQIAILLIAICGKITESVLKILSMATTYMSLDSYFRGTNMAIEIWQLVELGVTVQDVMTPKSDASSITSRGAHRSGT
ncbi:uncharacterized protein SPPG_03736 [Spizellomyces punctatus DAOM BR117]|uniref:G-protein coupled receptors family 1 profile domain-containing protein n=1 Tax=Spizellomyces punctatus (strain DAOM BR117) TaxID=645134 RepID=A0A0L0HIG0_SPIPD|nr:uncharacterized protein SPPG_03736 [Spizellomyces punctatus DAOM BR117]KND00609.1 hypothetical protein SPPG_03736 [Spizellomyces punctatus DAOM BR117]|eukprot:XP_016608648.1 hypothetical protein SPPG_03736 [Spizellomyces punctatus DAOM BR117]